MVEICDGDSVRVHGLGGFLDAEYVWRITINPNRTAELLREFEMRPLDRKSVPDAFWSSFPGWWRPSADRDSLYYATANFPADSRGPDGLHFIAMLDTSTNRLYVWHKDNF